MIVSLDLGSRYCGVAVLEDALPARVAGSVTLVVEEGDVTATANRIKQTIDLAVAECKRLKMPSPRAIIEWGRFYVPAKATPQSTAAAGAAMGEARDPMICIRDRVEQHCKGLDVKVIRVNARTWRTRIGCKGRDDAAVSAALALHAGLGSLADEHQRDAAGAAMGVLIGERDAPVTGPPRKRREKGARAPSKASARTLAMRAQDAAVDALCEQGALRILAAPVRVTMALEAVPVPRPCGCGARGPHHRGCAEWSAPVPKRGVD